MPTSARWCLPVLLLLACGPASVDQQAPDGPAALRLLERFDPQQVSGTPADDGVRPVSTSWRFDGPPQEASAGDGTSDGPDGGAAPGDDEPESGSPDAGDDPPDAGGDGTASDDDAGDDDAGDDDDGPPPIFELDEGEEPPVAVRGWHALSGLDDLAVRDGLLVGTLGEMPILHTVRPEGMDEDDLLHAVEVRLQVPSGERLDVSFNDPGPLDLAELLERAADSDRGQLSQALRPGDEVQTYTFTAADSGFAPAIPIADAHHLFLRVRDAEPGDQLALESVRLISRREHLAERSTGVSWEPCAQVYREALVARSPQVVRFDVDLPGSPWLDLELGTVDEGALTFRVDVTGPDGAVTRALTRTLTTPDRWEPVPVSLEDWAGLRVTLSLGLQAEHDGALGLWGSPVVRSRGAQPEVLEPSTARAALGRPGPPQGVILIITDTLRKDHLDLYGYERATAPVLAGLAAEGVRFDDAISQGSWTKVSVSSILTSLYPSTHGVVDSPDRLPASVTTLAESFQQAGYATFATSSVPFTGKLTNLHQGHEVLHERSSVQGGGSKTARVFVDRLVDWLQRHQDVPFFARLHVFDPHSPFEPRRPYAGRFTEEGAGRRHEQLVEQVREVMEPSARKARGLPWQHELDEAGIAADEFTRTEIDWYDASIRGMDAELGRLMERLEQLGLADDVLIAVIADHGEEFLEHGRHWHGDTAYGEMTNVPLLLRWPGVLPASTVAETVQSIDLAPTLRDLCGLPAPALQQGRSLLPLLSSPDDPRAHGWRPGPAISEVRLGELGTPDPEEDLESVSIVVDGWRLIHNLVRPEGHPEIELFDHVKDPLNRTNLADQHPEVVADLLAQLARWQERADAQRLQPDDVSSMSEADREQLRALGYLK